MTMNVQAIRDGLTWGLPPGRGLPAGLTLIEAHDHRHCSLQWLQLILYVRADEASLVAAGVVTEAQLQSFTPCGQRSFDIDFGPYERFRSDCIRMKVIRQKRAMRVEIVVYGKSNPELARYLSWMNAPVARGKPTLRLLATSMVQS
jgi:hypothetical protein